MKRKQSNRKPAQHQLDPQRIDTQNVQFWRNGIMITAQLSNQEARNLVANGSAFVITGQAIGALDDNGCFNS